MYPASVSLEPGTRLGPYEIVRLLGAGGMGEVYRARDTKLDREVAVKVLPARLALDAAALTRFEREAKAVAALSHPNILAIHDFGTHEGTTYAVTELLSGETLRARLAGAELPVRKALDFGGQIADGLAAAHEKGLVHRDVKPENVFVTNQDRVKILDFGLVRHQSEDDDTVTAAMACTAPGTFLGTTGYASPEQALGRPVDFRSDQFALGSVLYEMLTGRRAFARSSIPETLSAVIRDEPEPIATLNPDVPAPLRWILERCLAKDPAERYASTHDLARELRTVRDHFLEASASGEIDRPGRTASPVRAARNLAYRPRVVGAAAVGLLILVAAGVQLYRSARRSPPVTLESVAVLPLVNGSGDPEADYLSDGITESLINSLARISTLRVMARTTVFSYKGRAVDPIKIGNELGVGRLLTGRVVPRGDDVSIQVDLVDVATGAQLWGQRYDRKLADILTVQDEIARHVSDTLRVDMTGDQQPSGRLTRNAAAYQLYLRGRFHWNKFTEEGARKSIEYFNQALALDPGFALAYVGLSDGYGILGQIGRPPRENAPQAKAYAEKALELDATLPEAHFARGAYELFYGWDWDVTVRELKRAAELNPRLGPPHDLYGQFLSATGHAAESIAENTRALEFDPLSANSNANLALAYYYARQYDRTVEQCRRTLELDPAFFFASLYIGAAYNQQGKPPEAIAELQKARDVPGGAIPITSELGYAYAVSSRRAAAEGMLRTLQEQSSRAYVDPYYVAIVHLGLGDLDQTFAWLERAYAERSFWLLWLNVEPKFDRLRSDGRFAALEQRMHFPR
jgi:eukaryotic-like serine/threonine-protein kinase